MAIRKTCKALPDWQGAPIHLSTPPVNPYRTSEVLAACELALKHAKGPQVILNVTGGTTPMNLGMFHTARAKQLPMIYVNTDENVILHLGADGQDITRTEPITIAVSAEAYVTAHGATLADRKNADAPWTANDCEAAQLMGVAGTDSLHLSDALNKANSTAGYMPAIHAPTAATIALCEQLCARGIVADVTHAAGEPLRFRVPDAHKPFAGKWLELYVAEALRAHSAFNNVRQSVEIKRAPGANEATVLNELDVVFTRGTHLGVISCKTGDVKDKKERKVELYELDSLVQAEMMGLFSRKIYVTNRPRQMLGEEFGQRARLTDIHVVTGETLPDIARKVDGIMQGAAG